MHSIRPTPGDTAAAEAGDGFRRADADQALSHGFVSSQLFVNIAHDCRWYGKTEPLIMAVLAEHERIDADQFSINAQQRTATVSGINGGVGLDI